MTYFDGVKDSKAVFRLSPPGLVLGATALYLVLGLTAWAVWRPAGVLFESPDALLLVALAAVELTFSLAVWREFLPGEPLRAAWFWISVAAGCHAVEAVFVQVLSQRTYLNPLLFTASWSEAQADRLRQFGLVVGGPLRLTLLAIGLLLVAQVYRRSGLLSNLTRVDWLLLAFLVVVTARGAYALTTSLLAGKYAPISEILGAITDPMLNLLLALSILIRRSVLNLGSGLIARCWGAFATGIVLTAVGNAGIWATGFGSLTRPDASVFWYVWLPVAAAFALGPACQAEAMRRARCP